MDSNAQLVCKRLGESDLMATSFYLAGETSLALQMGHRRSLDLDFFQKSSAERIAFNRITRELKRLFGESQLLYPLVEGETKSPVLTGVYLAGLPAFFEIITLKNLMTKNTIN